MNYYIKELGRFVFLAWRKKIIENKIVRFIGDLKFLYST